ncbi:MAG: hypothetical protein KDD82_15460, partial [Planctomycetes bacterium]|nr:hypothetical protein [Planctomycetota bacterium]
PRPPRVRVQAPTPAPADAPRVVNPQGVGIPGARVAIRLEGSERVHGVLCDGAGRFSLKGLPRGACELVAAAPDWVASKPVRWCSGDAPPTITLDPGLAIRGRVARVDGGSLPAGVAVFVEQAPEAYVGPERVEVDASGAFSLRGVPAGALSLRAKCLGWAGSTLGGSSAALAAQEPQLVLRRLELCGRVEGGNPALAPPEVVAVDALGARLEVQARAGGFAFALPHGGPWRLRARQAEISSAWVERSLDDADPGPLTLTLEELPRILGVVHGPGGEPLEGASVWVGEEAGACSTDAGGGFSLRLPDPEARTLHARYPGLAGVAVSLADYDLAQPVVLRLDTLIPLERRPFLGADGAPLEVGLAFDPLPPDPHVHALGRPAFDVQLDAQGLPRLDGLPDGVWVVSFPEPAPDELRAWVREVDTQDQGLSLGFSAPALRGKLAGHVALRGEEPEGVQLLLQPADPEASEFQFRAARFPAADGSFEFSAVPAGEYRLQALGPSGRGEPQRVQVVEGATTRVVLDGR